MMSDREKLAADCELTARNVINDSNPLVDLHMHSTFSDGRYTPMQLVEVAASKGLAVLALTDHDSWNGVAEAQAAAARLGNIRVLTGVELGTQCENDSVHILGYHVNMSCEPLHAKMDEMRHGRELRLTRMLAKLDGLGYHIEVEACDPKNRAVGRPHVAKALVAAGYFNTVQEVFDALLHRGGPAYVPQPKLAPEEAVQLIHEAGGIAVLAHPSELSDGTLPERLLRAVPFDGVEVYHPSADKKAQAKWLQLAQELQLLVGGGSDFHAIPDRYPTELGVWQVRYEDVKGVIEWK
ncbi:MAG: PHP domain-containing protein [Phascolarctobacterium sp.]|nr:PHP domain-containing protein [Phascolarctobacterium sp.]